MDFLCPHCQKMLTVPDQYAGTMMKCPLCQNTFHAPSAAPAAPPLPPVGTLNTSTATPPRKAPPSAPPDLTTAPPGAKTPSTAPSSRTSAAQAPLPSPGDSPRGFTLPISPRVLPWIAAGGMILILLLQLFTPWVGMYPGGYGVYTQGPWYAALDYYNVDKVWTKVAQEQQAAGDARVLQPIDLDALKDRPGWNPLMILYGLLSLLTVVVTVASAVLPQAPVKLPPQVERLMPWRWAIVAGLALVTFLLLGLQLLLGFSMENAAANEADRLVKPWREKATTPEDTTRVNMLRGALLNSVSLRHTGWLWLAFILHLVVLAAAALQLWIEHRSPTQPMPQLALRL